jgi:hypothetical protein
MAGWVDVVERTCARVAVGDMAFNRHRAGV